VRLWLSGWLSGAMRTVRERRQKRWEDLMASIGVGDLRQLLQLYFSTSAPVDMSGPVDANTSIGEFTATVTGTCSIFVSVDTSGVHLQMADVTLDNVYRGVDGGQYLLVDEWQIFVFRTIVGHTYSFQVTKACSIALQVTYNPLSS
jgi:hypothetical protein